MLEAAGPDFANVVVFHSLSKRSNLPGLRVGFAAGDRRFLGPFLELRNVAAPQVPTPAQHVGDRRLWRRSACARKIASFTRAKFDLADQIIGDRYGYERPAGGFFLWLDVSEQGGSEAVTKTTVGAKPACASCRGAISRANRPTAAIPARTISASPWCRTRRPRQRRCIASSRCSGRGCNRMRAADRSLDIIAFVSEHFRDIVAPAR